MREKLKQYIEQLFARAPRTQSAQELKEEMLQNLLDKYDDLIMEGKTEEDAYRLAVAGIGDVSGLIGGLLPAGNAEAWTTQPEPKQRNPIVLACAIALYVIAVIPTILLGGGTGRVLLGIVLMFVLVAIATAMLIMNRTVVHPTRAALVGVGVALFIMCPVPVILMGNVFGVTLLFVMIGIGVGLVVYGCSDTFAVAPDDAENTAKRTYLFAYGMLGALALLFVLCSAFSGSAHKPVTVYGLHGEIIGGADGTTGIVIDDDFEDRLEDAIEERIDSDSGEDIEDAIDGALSKPGKENNDAAGKGENGKSKSDKVEKKAAAATAAMLEGAMEIPAAGITEIDIDWVGGSVNITPYSGDTIAVSETSTKPLTDGQKLRYTVKGNKLSISYCEDTAYVWDWLDLERLSMPAKALTVQLPDGVLPDVEVNAVSAEVSVSGIAIDELDIESVSGDIQVTDVTGRKLNVQTTSGRSTVRGADVTKLNLESTSGRIEVAESAATDVELEVVSAKAEIGLVTVPTKFEAETVSGNVTLTLPKDATDFTVQMETVSGDFSCGIPSIYENGRYVVGGGNLRYEFSSISGNFQIVAG